MKQVDFNQLLGFQFDSQQFLDNNCRHVFGARSASNQGNFAFSGHRDIVAATAVRKTWCDFIDADSQQLVVGGQTHTAHVAIVDSQHASRGALAPTTVIPECDGLITLTPGLPLYVAVADCSAVLLSAPGIVGVVHGGWRGLQANILPVAVAHFAEFGASVETISAGVAPCIQAASYEVGPEVAIDCPAVAKYRGEGDRWHVDIGMWAKQQLMDSGLAECHIEMSGMDSRSDPRVFSHRREGTPAGRNGLLAVLGD
jgi:YfiH family protein